MTERDCEDVGRLDHMEADCYSACKRALENTRTQQGECKHLDDGMCGNVADDKICCYSPKKEG